MKHTRELTQGNILIGLWAFAVPLMLGNVMQQLYNLVDTWVVGKYIGEQALAAVGASYTLVTFLTSVILGLCLGAGAFFSMAYGKKDWDAFRNGLVMSFTAIGGLALIVMVVVYLLLNSIIQWLQVPQETFADMRTYLVYVMAGFFATFLYNYYANVLRSVGNSVIPLVFLAVSVVLNIGLDLLFVIPLQGGIAGAAVATVISQYISGIGIGLYFIKMYPEYWPQRKDVRWDGKNLKQIMSLSGFTCLQQSVMNFGILMIQGLVNSFGAVIGCKNRYDRLYAGAGFWKCVFGICRTEFWCRKERADPRRSEICGTECRGFLRDRKFAGCLLFTFLDEFICGCRKCRIRSRGMVSSDRGGLLCGHWNIVPALRIFSRSQ